MQCMPCRTRMRGVSVEGETWCSNGFPPPRRPVHRFIIFPQTHGPHLFAPSHHPCHRIAVSPPCHMQLMASLRAPAGAERPPTTAGAARALFVGEAVTSTAYQLDLGRRIGNALARQFLRCYSETSPEVVAARSIAPAACNAPNRIPEDVTLAYLDPESGMTLAAMLNFPNSNAACSLLTRMHIGVRATGACGSVAAIPCLRLKRFEVWFALAVAGLVEPTSLFNFGPADFKAWDHPTHPRYVERGCRVPRGYGAPHYAPLISTPQ